jgi:ABC-type nitrate/sulfonate/bicarbonate transport system permease component
MANKRARKRRRSTSEKIFIVLSIIIALSMILALFVSFGAGTSSSLPEPSLVVMSLLPTLPW